MPDHITFTVRCSVAWWFRPYVALLKLCVLATRRMPSDEHIDRIAMRAVRTRLIEHRAEAEELLDGVDIDAVHRRVRGRR